MVDFQWDTWHYIQEEGTLLSYPVTNLTNPYKVWGKSSHDCSKIIKAILILDYSLPNPILFWTHIYSSILYILQYLCTTNSLVLIWRLWLSLLWIYYYYYYYYYYYWLPLWSSGQSSWLQIQKSWFNSQRYQIFCEVVGLKWDPLSLVGTTEVLLRRNTSGSGLEMRDYGRRDPPCWPCGTLYP
jgi:hypothetical protein